MTINIKTSEFRLNDLELKAVLKVKYRKNFKVFQILWIFILLLTLLSFYLSIKSSYGLVTSSVSNSFFVVGLIIYFIVIYRILLKKLKNSKLIQKSSFIEINQNYISQSYDDGSFFKVNFDLFREVVKHDSLYIFIGEDVVSFFLPKRACNSELELQEIDSFLTEKKILNSW